MLSQKFSKEQNDLNLSLVNDSRGYDHFKGRAAQSLRALTGFLFNRAFGEVLDSEGCSFSETESAIDEAIRYALSCWQRERDLTLADYELFGLSLSAPEQDSLLNLLTYRCGEKTKRRVRSIIRYTVDRRWGLSYGTMSRIVIFADNLSYIPGQCGTSEIRAIRSAMIN